MRKIKLLLFVISVPFVFQSCETKCVCEELEYNEEKKLWMKIETGEIYGGVCESEYDDGVKKEHKEFKSGKVFGIWTTYFENGNIEHEEKFHNANMVEERWFFENGKMKNEWKYKNGKLIESREWYETGNKKIEHIYGNNEPSFKSIDGWYDSGSIAYHFISQGENGIIFKHNNSYIGFSDVFKYIDNLINGKGTVIDENDNILVEAFWKSEKQVKKTYTYYDYGTGSNKQNTTIFSVSVVSYSKDNKKRCGGVNQIIFYDGSCRCKCKGETLDEALIKGYCNELPSQYSRTKAIYELIK